MTAYIDDKIAANVISFDLPLESSNGETGTVVLDGEIEISVGKILRIDNHLFRIAENSSVANNQTTLKVYDGLSSVANAAAYPFSVEPTDEDVIGADFANLAIGFAYQWNGNFSYLGRYSRLITNENVSRSNISIVGGLTASNRTGTSHSGWTQKEIDAQTNYQTISSWLDGLGITLAELNASVTDNVGRHYAVVISADALLRAIQKRGYSVDIKRTTYSETYDEDAEMYLDKTLVYLTSVSMNQLPLDVVFFNDGHSELISEFYKDDVVSHIYLIRELSQSGDFAFNGWWSLMPDGTVEEHYRDDAVVGYDSFLCASVGDGEEEAALRQIFDANKREHKIEFASDKVLHLGQPVKLMLKRGILDTAISKVSIKSGDDRFFYSCGELPATAADKIHANSWSYGQRLPLNPYKGQLVIVEE